MPTITIAKRFTLDAAHHLPTMPEGHKCRRLHGHTYVVEVQLRGTPDPKLGYFVDYQEIADAWAPIHERLDHRLLNEIDGLDYPTTEVLVVWMFRALSSDARIGRYLDAITVAESSTTWARITREDFELRFRSLDEPIRTRVPVLAPDLGRKGS